MAIDIKKCELKIIVDSREQVWGHIEEAFKANKIDYYVAKSKEGKKCLEVGDYSIIVKTPKGNILDFRKYAAVERKGSLNEFAGNLTDNKSIDEFKNNRIKREFIRGLDNQTRVMLLIEEEDGYNKALNGFFRWDKESKLNKAAFMGMLWSWEDRYNFKLKFCERKTDSWHMIYNYLYYVVRNYLKEFREDSLKYWREENKGSSSNYYYIYGHNCET